MLREDGERFLPWMADPVINYEHLHRYRAAREVAAGRRVVDLASGEGYGSAMIAGTAAAVIGLELDREAVAHAAMSYPLAGLSFVQGSITEMPFRRERFDLAVCFEALEHVAEQDRLCAEVARILSPGGWFIVSTPNRAVYTEQSGYCNPFHVKELNLPEFRALLGRHFPHVHVLGQHIYPVSSIFAFGAAPAHIREYVAAREAGEERYAFVGPARKETRYFMAIASQSPLPADAVPPSLLVDASEQLFAVQRRAEGAVIELTRHLEVRERQVLDLEERRLQLQAALGEETASRQQAVGRLREAERHLAARAEQAERLDELLRRRDELLRRRDLDVQDLEGSRDALLAQIAAMEATRAWRLYQRSLGVLRRLGLRRA